MDEQIIDIEATVVEEPGQDPVVTQAPIISENEQIVSVSAKPKKPRKPPIAPVRRILDADGNPVKKVKKPRKRYPKHTLTNKDRGISPQDLLLARAAFTTLGNEDYPWYPQADETAKAYLLFKGYLDLGPTRTYTDLATIMGIERHKIVLWSKEHDWDARARAYNDHIVALEFVNREKVIADKAAQNAELWLVRQDEIREKAFNNANELIEVAMEMLRFPRTKQETYEDTIEIDGKTGKETITRYTTIIEPIKWGVRDIAVFLKEADRLQRLSANMETSNQKITVEKQSTDLTFDLLLDFVGSGKAIAEAREQMINVLLMAPEHVDAAIQRMKDGQQPMKQIAGTRVDD